MQGMLEVLFLTADGEDKKADSDQAALRNASLCSLASLAANEPAALRFIPAAASAKCWVDPARIECLRILK